MGNDFDQMWLTGTSEWIDEILWAAVVRRVPTATRECTHQQVQAAWAAYCDYAAPDDDPALRSLCDFIQAGEGVVDGPALYALVSDHPAMEPLVAAVADAIAATNT